MDQIKRIGNYWLLVLTMLFAYSGASSQIGITPDLRFDNYNRYNHFVTEYCYNIYRDKKGYVWTSGNGLYRFDGLRYKHYTNFSRQGQTKLSDNFVANVFEDNYGRLWINGGGGLGYYDYKRDSFIYINPDRQHPINFSYSFCELNNKLWFTSNFGLCNIDLQTLKVSYTSIKSIIYPTGTFAADENTLVVSTLDESYLYKIRENLAIKNMFLRGIDCGALVKTTTGWLWGEQNGLFSVQNIEDTPRLIKGTEYLGITSLARQNKHDSLIWVGTNKDGLKLYNIKSNKIISSYNHDERNPNSLQDNEITSLYADGPTNLWIGTTSGLSLLNVGNQSIKTHLFGEDYIYRVVRDKYDQSIVWASSVFKGLLKIDWRTQSVIGTYGRINRDKIEASRYDIRDMYQTGKGKWILLKSGALVVWNSAIGVISYVNDFPLTAKQKAIFSTKYIIPWDSGRFFITSNQGLFLYNSNTNNLSSVIPRSDFDENSFMDLRNGFVEGDTLLWLATAKGVLKYGARSKQIRSYAIADSVEIRRANIFTDIASDSKGNIYCTGVRGIGRVDASTDKISLIDTFNALVSPSCFSIKIIGNIAWVNSNAGLIGYDVSTCKTNIIIPEYFLNYSVETFGQVNDELVLCLRGAFCYFKPSSFLQWPIPSTPLIEKFQVNNKDLPQLVGKAIRLKYFQNNLNIEFTAFEFNDPQHIKFRYRLKGLEDDWHITDEQRTANYSQVPPGAYVFEVQSGNNKGEWNTQITRLSFEIIPPIWGRFWFRIAIVLFFVAVVIGVAIWRIRRVKIKEANKTAINKTVAELEMKVLRSQMNPHFIFNSLNSIQKFIWENKQEDASEYLTKFSRLIRSILDNSMNKLITLEQELATLALYVELEHRRSSNKFDYRITVDEHIAVANILIPPLIIQPYVENAIWHGLLHKNERGELRIQVTQRTLDSLQIIIQDNGVGRERAKAKQQNTSKHVSYGMKITAQRLAMNDHIDKHGEVVVDDLIENGIACGTRVTISLPVVNFIKV